MKALLTLAMAVLIGMTIGIALAEQRYNPYSGEWETVPDRGYISRDPYTGEYKKVEPELKYNPYEGEWQYTDPNARLEYNPHKGRWEYPR